jgi:hypothetical protein
MMKKWIVIATMAFSMAAFTACGSKNDTTNDTGITQDQDEETNTEAQEQTDADAEDSEQAETADDDSTQAEKEDGTEDTDASAQDAEDGNSGDSEKDTSSKKKNSKKKNKDKTSKDNEEEELIETGEEPDFKVNENGCFNGTYEGNDGCVYKFTKKGILTVTSDSETVEWEYMLNGDLLNMMLTDGSMGQVLQITLLDDGTYLLDDTLGTQVVLTYVK